MRYLLQMHLFWIRDKKASSHACRKSPSAGQQRVFPQRLHSTRIVRSRKSWRCRGDSVRSGAISLTSSCDPGSQERLENLNIQAALYSHRPNPSKHSQCDPKPRPVS